MKQRAIETFILVSATSLAFTAMMYANPAQADPVVKITIAGIKARQGNVMIGLYDEKSWPTDQSLVGVEMPVEGDSINAVLLAPLPGSYAIKIYHDVDGDGVLGKNIMGLPTEPFGFSNNAPAKFGPAEFKDAAFDIGSDGAAQNITLRLP